MEIRHRVKVSIPGLEGLLPDISRRLLPSLQSFSNNAQTRLRSKMRRDKGEEEKDIKVAIGGLDPARLRPYVRFTGRKVQTLVDETGAKPHFPPIGRNSKLRGWVRRKGWHISTIARGNLRRNRDDIADDERELTRITFAIAKAQSKRGLPRPGDPLRKPWATTAKETKGLFEIIVNREIAEAVREANRVA